MFSWICPRCGREVPPAETECPNCKGLEAAPGAPAAQQPQPIAQAAPSQPVSPAPPQHPAQPSAAPAYQQAPGYQPPPAQTYTPPYPARPRGGPRLPTWLLTLLFAFAFVGLGAGIYWGVGYFR